MFSRPRWAPQKPTKKKKLQTQPKQVTKGNSYIFGACAKFVLCNFRCLCTFLCRHRCHRIPAVSNPSDPVAVNVVVVAAVSLLSRSCSFRFHCQHQYTGAQNYSPHSHRHCVVLLVGVGNEGLIRTCFWHWPNFHVSSCTLSFAVRCNSCWGRGCC